MSALAAAAIVGSALQAGKGIYEISQARRMRGMAAELQRQGESGMNTALNNRQQYAVSDALNQSRNLALNQYYSNNAGRNAAALGEKYASTAASQAKRGASTSADVASSAFMAEQMANEAALKGEAMNQQSKLGSLNAVMNANATLASAQDKAYEYNVMMPFKAAYDLNSWKFQSGLQGSIDSINRRSAAWGDMMNGITNAVMTAGYTNSQFGKR